MEQIQGYLTTHPKAADTLQGVHDWWLGAPGPELSVAVVQAALRRLVAKGVVECRRIPGGRVFTAKDPFDGDSGAAA